MILLLQAVLGVLAIYHLAIGVASVLSFDATSRIVAGLYEVQLQATAQLRYAIRMLGVSALALGALMALAALDPAGRREIVLVVAGLQLARATCRVVFRRELREAFGVPPRRNAAAIAVLLFECVALLVGVALS